MGIPVGVGGRPLLPGDHHGAPVGPTSIGAFSDLPGVGGVYRGAGAGVEVSAGVEAAGPCRTRLVVLGATGDVLTHRPHHRVVDGGRFPGGFLLGVVDVIGQGGHHLDRVVPERGVVVGVGVALSAVGGQGGLHAQVAGDLDQRLEEVGGRDPGGGAVVQGSPSAVVPLLEQAPGVGAGGVAVVEVEQRGLPHGGHHPDRDRLAVQVQVLTGGDDFGGVG